MGTEAFALVLADESRAAVGYVIQHIKPRDAFLLQKMCGERIRFAIKRRQQIPCLDLRLVG